MARGRRRRIVEALESRCLLATLGGEVFFDVDGNGQQDLNETGANAIRVYLDANENGQLDSGEFLAQTNPDGTYAITGVPAGDYAVRVEAPRGQVQTAPFGFLGTGYSGIGNNSSTQLYEMTATGDVTLLGNPTTQPMHDLVRTNSGRILGINFNTDAIYSINPVTGEDTLLATSSRNVVAGLAYDPATDTVYTLAQVNGDTQALHTVDPINGQLSPAIGSGLSGLSGVSDLTFDTVNNRIVGFDNSDDEFFQFNPDGSAVRLSTAARSLDSWSLAFDGSKFVMFDQGDPNRTQTLEVNPDTGEIVDGFVASQRIPTEGLFHARRGETPHRVSVGPSDVLVDLDFGLITVDSQTNRIPDHPTVISEIMVDTQFGNADTDQVLEFRGVPGGQLNDNTYFVIVDENDTNAGEIHGIFDLSNQPLGNNGYLTILQFDSPHQVDSGSAVLQSTSEGFGGLPGGIYTDSHSSTDRIDFILGANAYFLIESDVPPQLGDDIDADDDGFADPAGVKSNWNVLDSVSMHPDVFQGSQAYGQIFLAEESTSDPALRTVEPGTPIVVADSFGYAGRIGESVGSDVDDWLFARPVIAERDANNRPVLFEASSSIFGKPNHDAYQLRDFDHFGEPNFVGGVRGTIDIAAAVGQTDANGDPLPPQPGAGLDVLADLNGNGVRDLINYVADPDDAVDRNNLFDPQGNEIRFPLANAFPGVTVTLVTDTLLPPGFDVETTRETTGFFTPTQNFIYSYIGIEQFNSIRRLRFDFYEPVTEASIVAIGPQFGITSTVGRLEAYDANDNLIEFDESQLLVGSARETITVSSAADNIAYVVAYGTNLNSARFDRLTYRQLEPLATTDRNGQFEIKNLFPATYTVAVNQQSQTEPLIESSPQTYTVTRNENFVFNDSLRPNSGPIVDPQIEFTVDENLSVGESIGFVTAIDSDGQGLNFQIVDDGGSGLLIDPVTGELTVGSNSQLDFEQASQLELIVGVSDPLVTSQTIVRVTLNDVNEAPIVRPQVMRVAEGTPANTAIGQIDAFDPDSSQNQTLSFQLIGGSGAAVFNVNPNNGLVILDDASAINFEANSELVIQVLVSDSAMPSLSTVTTQRIEIIDQNDPPTLPVTTFTVPENSTGTLFQIPVDDPDSGQSHRFEPFGGADADLFNISLSGEVMLRDGVSLDFEQENSFELGVIAIDSGAPPAAVQGMITILLSDVNEPPELVDPVVQVPENSAAGTAVSVIQVSDPEQSGASYQTMLLVQADSDQFEFDPTTGQLTVADGAVLDFEAQESLRVFFQITDSTGVDPVTIRELIVELEDQNEPPTLVTEQVVLSELAAPGTVVGRVEVQINEPDRGDIVTVQIVGGPGAPLFTLDPNTRILRVAEGAQFDADGSQPPLSLDIEVRDQGGLFSVGTVNILLNDVNEAPVIESIFPSQTLFSGQPLTIEVPSDAIVDPEGNDFSVAIFDEFGGLPGWMEYDAATRTLTGLPTPLTLGSFPLTLRAFEAGPLDLFNEVSFTIDVVLGTTPLTNQRNPFDVDANGEVAVLDALRVVNFLTRNGVGVSAGAGNRFTGFVDTSGDGLVNARDALLLINHLQRQSTSSPLSSEAIGSQQRREGLEAIDRALDDLFGQSNLF